MISKSALSTQKNKTFFKTLWNLAIPISLQCMMFSLLGLLDILMVGQLGETAVAAVGFGNRIFFFNLIVVASLGGGLSILASQYIGAGNRDGIRQTLAQALITSTLVTIPFITAYLLYTQQIILFASNDSNLLKLGSDYLLITAPSFLCTAIVVPLESALRASNDAKTPTRVSFLTILVNIILNYILIYGALGIPAMGVSGSALGTVIARVFQLVLLGYYLHNFKSFLLPSIKDFRTATQYKAIKKYLKVSIPLVFQDGLWAFGVILYHLIYGQMGVDDLAIMSTISAVEAILISLFIGFAIGCSIMLGHELGASQFNTAWKQGWFFLAASPIVALMIGLVIAAFNSELVVWFGQFKDETVIEASQVMTVAGFALCIRVINLIGIVGVLRSGGDVNATAVINIIGMWCVGLPLAWVAATVWQLPLYMVFICALMEEVTKAILVIYRVIAGRWLKNLVSEPIDIRTGTSQ